MVAGIMVLPAGHAGLPGLAGKTRKCSSLKILIALYGIQVTAKISEKRIFIRDFPLKKIGVLIALQPNRCALSDRTNQRFSGLLQSLYETFPESLNAKLIYIID